MKMYTGSEVKQEILNSGFRLWQVADKLGISEFTFSRKLRHSFTEDEHEKILYALNELSKKA